jgi:glycosyltransferase involved in cell wall biosynthesis
MVLKGFPRISETFISNEIFLLEQAGINIRIISLRHPRESFSHESVNRIRARVDYLPSTILGGLPRLMVQNLMLAAKHPKIYAGALKIAFRRFLRTRKSATLKHLLQAGVVVNQMLPGSGIVHFHAHFAHSPTSVAFFSSLLSGLPFSFTAHAKDIYTTDPRQLREKIAMAEFVATCTEYNRKHLKSLAGSARTPIHRIYHGIDLNLFSGRDKNALPSNPYQILTVARLTAKKGLPTVFKALRHLCDQGIAVQHTLIGDGDDRDDVMALIHELKLEAVTQWIGTQPHHVVLDHYRRADLFVLGCEVAANGDRDGIPNVLVESMAMGVPVVSTDVSAIPELVQDGETGLLVAPGKPRALAAAMARMLVDTTLRQKIIHQADMQVRQHFDNRALIDGLARIHKAAMAGQQ